jgi:GAF domain-containing protein
VKSAIRLRIGEGVTGWVAKEGVPLLVKDVREDPRYFEASPKVMCEMAVPIKWGSEVMGVINLDHHQVNGFQEEDLEMLVAFGHVAGVALRNANVLRDWTTDTDEAALPCGRTVLIADGVAVLGYLARSFPRVLVERSGIVGRVLESGGGEDLAGSLLGESG